MMKEFDLESLAQFNGEEGRPCYVVYKGKVFDVSTSKLWNIGLHMKRHTAGQDLTVDIEAAPHGPEKLNRYPQVGVLKTNIEIEENFPKPLVELLERFPFIQRHPHPMLVHFPIAFTISPALFYLLYLITGGNAFETTAYYCLGAGILFSTPAILTGFLTWWFNYQLRPTRPIIIKILFSILLVTISLAAFLLRLFLPDKVKIVYLILLFLLIPVVSVIGWYGASLTFPLKRK